jgi:hypothetical protein
MSRKKIVLSEKVINEVKVLLRYGNTYDEISKKTGFSKTVLNRAMLERGIRFRKEKTFQEKAEDKQLSLINIKEVPTVKPTPAPAEKHPVKTLYQVKTNIISMRIITPRHLLKSVLNDLKETSITDHVSIQIKVEG